MRQVIAIAILAFLPLSARAVEIPGLSLENVLKIGKRIPYGLVIEVLDEVTRRHTTESKAKLRGLVPQLKLNVHSATVDVVVTGEEIIWRGSTTVKLTMPADVQYVVDLSELAPENVKWDKVRRLLKIKLPEVRVGTVSPRLEEESVEVSAGWLRPSWFRGGRAEALEGKLRREDYRPMAVREAEKRLDDARRSARDQVRDLLRRLWLDKDSAVEIVVE